MLVSLYKVAFHGNLTIGFLMIDQLVLNVVHTDIPMKHLQLSNSEQREAGETTHTCATERAQLSWRSAHNGKTPSRDDK